MERDNSIIRVEGFNRSGNTFLLNLLRESFPDLNIPYFDHSTANLFYSNTFVPVRTPKESIPSIRHLLNTNDLDALARWYIRYYKTIKKNINSLYVIDFIELINNPNDVIKKVSNIINVEPVKINIEQIIKNETGILYEKNITIPSLKECMELFEEVRGYAI